MGSTPSRSSWFTRLANGAARATGKPITFIIAAGIVVVWAISGPVFGFSDTWQLIINTGTTIVTFLMVFLIQNTQNRDGAAVQAKLDELIRASTAHTRALPALLLPFRVATGPTPIPPALAAFGRKACLAIRIAVSARTIIRAGLRGAAVGCGLNRNAVDLQAERG